MKQNEKDILDSVNKEFNIELKWNDYEYNRFDAEDKNYIVEIKDRNKYYDNTMIEFDKYSFNIKYAELAKKKFIYVVRVDGNIYIFNLSKDDTTFGWEWKLIEATTNFKNRKKIKKLVGYIRLEDCTKKIDTH
tara:strand:+ start:1231 stop:1629 length:399 start_codon:yes stop_codon:yes gene_type:complete